VAGERGRGPTTRDLLALAIGLAGSAAAITVMFLAMRSVMGVGGSCASGGPYVIATPCPDGTAAGMTLGVFALLGFGALAAWSGSRVGGIWSNTLIFCWAGLFIALGWNFLDAGFAVEGGFDVAGLLLGGLFWAMGGVPLIAVLLLAVRGSAGRSSGTRGAQHPVPVAREGFAPYPQGHHEGRHAPSPAATDGRAVREQLLSAIARDLDAVETRAADGITIMPGAGADPVRDAAALSAHLERLADLHTKGLLDDAEYATAKGAILKALEGIG
jgi:hypothetical protein